MSFYPRGRVEEFEYFPGGLCGRLGVRGEGGPSFGDTQFADEWGCVNTTWRFILVYYSTGGTVHSYGSRCNGNKRAGAEDPFHLPPR